MPQHMTYKTPEEIMNAKNKRTDEFINYDDAIAAMKEYGDQQWNAALDAVIEHHPITFERGEWILNKELILSLKR